MRKFWIIVLLILDSRVFLLIADLIQQLTKERDNFETEKSENRETIKMLEARLKQMTTVTKEKYVNNQIAFIC